MAQTTARIKQAGKHFEIIVDLDSALKFKKTGQGSASDFLEIDQIFSDSKKGFKASDADLKSAFNSTDVNAIAERIVKQGELLLTQEHRDEERDKAVKRVVDFLVRNSVDPQSGRPHTAERIKSALEEAGVNVKNASIESQIPEITGALSKVLPIKISTKKVKITVPAMHTGKVYGVLNQFKEKEDWLNNGDLEVIVNVPAGMIMEFYDKLNSITHGSALTEELKNDESGGNKE